MNERNLAEEKICRLCNKTKLKYLDFSITKYRNGNERVRTECKTCRCQQEKERRKANLEAHKERDMKYHEANKEKRNNENRERRKRMKDKYNAQKKEYYNKNRDVILQYHRNNKKKRNIRVRLNRKHNIQSQLIYILRARYNFKSLSTKVLLDCTVEQFKYYLENQFSDKMNWSNYGTYWVIDHIIPLAFFKLASTEEQQLCFHWSNLQPLSRIDNASKSAKIITHTIIKHALFIQQFIDLNEGYQASIEKCWWQRVKLWYGKNPDYKDDFKSLLCRIIRNWESFQLS